MHKFTRTIYSIMLECLKSVGAPFTLLDASTLNEKYDVPVFSDKYPEIQYFGVGLDYHDLVNSPTLDFTDPLHGAADGDVFRPVPLVVRPTTIGLTDTEKARYRMKVIRVINGIEYIVCYLRKIDYIAPYTNVYEITHTPGNNFLDLIDLNKIHALSPVPKFRNCSDTAIKFAAFDMKLKINLNAGDIVELKNAISIMYGNTGEAYLSTIGEVGLYHGVEVNTVTDVEAASVQAAYFSRVREPIGVTFSHNIDLGGMTPYYI